MLCAQVKKKMVATYCCSVAVCSVVTPTRPSPLVGVFSFLLPCFGDKHDNTVNIVWQQRVKGFTLMNLSQSKSKLWKRRCTVNCYFWMNTHFKYFWTKRNWNCAHCAIFTLNGSVVERERYFGSSRCEWQIYLCSKFVTVAKWTSQNDTMGTAGFTLCHCS